MLKKKILNYFIPVIFGSNELIIYYIKKLNININLFNLNNIYNISYIKDNVINIINIINNKIIINPGIATYYGKKYSIKSLKISTDYLINNLIDLLITCPINKKLVYSKNKFPFFGHTEYLQYMMGNNSLMIMIHEKIKIALVTNHIPLKEISFFITKELIINKLLVLHNSLIKDFSITKPKIAVLGLNPHSGDDGLIGNEENIKIKPAIKKLSKLGYSIFGPYPADSFFRNYNYIKFDATLAIYHDQGLIPFKIISNYKGTNFTAGLSYIRVSPEHGVAYDIAGKGIANEYSFENSIYRGINIYYSRKNNVN